MFYVEAITTHTGNIDECLFRETAIGDNKKSCIKRVLQNLSDYNRQSAFLDDEYADIKVYSSVLRNGAYVPDKLIESIAIECLGDYEIFLKSLK